MLSKLGVRELDVQNRRVFVRVDFNVPIDQGTIADDTRIRASIPTIRLLMENGARIVLAAHRGRPKGRREEDFSLRRAAERLGELLDCDVALAPDCVGEAAQKHVDALEPGHVVLLENLRFHAGEEENEPEFVAELAKLGDVYVNDAFGAAHRAHASTVGVAELLRPAAAGLLMEREIEYLGKAMHDPERPFFAILGGAKVSDKIGIIRNLLQTADAILVGGAMAYTFLAAMSRHVGSSHVEVEKIDVARDTLIESLQRRVPLYLPLDHLVADEFSASAQTRVVNRGVIPDGWEGLDIGPATLDMYTEVLRRAKTVVWNGPLGVYEFERFARGTLEVARVLAEMKATTIVGGGDCVAAVHQAGVADEISHISTGGGASIEFLEGCELPGVAALSDRESA